MKTTDYWHKRLDEAAAIFHNPLCNKTEREIRYEIIAEIQRDAREGACAGYRNALERLASLEAFDVPRAVSAHDTELLLRMNFAKNALSPDAGRGCAPKPSKIANL